MMRLDKYLKETIGFTRTIAKKCIKSGVVSVNNQTIKNDDYKVDEEKDVVRYKDDILEYKKYIYIMLNKPSGVVSVTEDSREKTVLDLIDEYSHRNLFPFGRLDKDSVGLLILSNDGKLGHELLSPKKHVDKKYYLKVKGRLTDIDVEAFKNGITLEDGYICKSATLEVIKSDEISECYATISEGKFHQLKRMFKMLEKEVVYLKRITFGNIILDEDLKEGEYRLLTSEEIRLLKEK